MSVLNMPVNQAKLTDYTCPTCGEENAKLINNDNPHRLSLDLCMYCGHIYRKRFLDKTSWIHFAKHYHKSAPNGPYFVKEHTKLTQIKCNAAEFYKDKKRMLDIGCMMGIASQALHPEVIGCELADKHFKFAKYYKKIDARNTYDIEDKSFDTIICWGSLMYVPHLKAFIEDIKKRLTPDGHLICHIPLIDRPNTEIVQNRFALEYAHFFTEQTITNFFASHSFDIIKIDYTLKDTLIILKKGKRRDFKRVPEATEVIIKNFVDVVALTLKKNAEAIIKIVPNFLDPHIALANANTKNPPKLTELVDNIDKQFPDYIPARASIANFYYHWRRYDQAIKEYEYCLGKMEAYDVVKNLAICYYDCGIYDKAIHYYHKCIEINPMDTIRIIEYLQACTDKIKDY